MDGYRNQKLLTCDTCGRAVSHLRRDVVDAGYNAITKPPLWNCDACYQDKRRRRHAAAPETSSAS